jgi:hypothetical protein
MQAMARVPPGRTLALRTLNDHANVIRQRRRRHLIDFQVNFTIQMNITMNRLDRGEALNWPRVLLTLHKFSLCFLSVSSVLTRHVEVCKSVSSFPLKQGGSLTARP